LLFQMTILNYSHIKTNLDIQKHMKFAAFCPDHFWNSTVILDLLNTSFKVDHSMVSVMVTVYTVVCF
uniref:Uncharacterized protein n=1 Tax=Marmota marmota marmota TaxID=9994 RepID=A0A8C6ABS6_MARMA